VLTAVPSLLTSAAALELFAPQTLPPQAGVVAALAAYGSRIGRQGPDASTRDTFRLAHLLQLRQLASLLCVVHLKPCRSDQNGQYCCKLLGV
jgi:hypothetical protein